MSLLTDSLNIGTVYFKDTVYTSDIIHANIDSVAEYLNKHTASDSPFVYLFAPNHIKMVYALFAIIKTGRICVLVDPALGRIEVEEMLRDTAPSAIIRIEKNTDTFDFSTEFEFTHAETNVHELNDLTDVCLIVYTSACDGFAKAAMLTNQSMLANAHAVIESNNVTEESVSCAIIAFHHLFALQTGLIAPSLNRSKILIVDTGDFKSIRNIGSQMQNFKVTHIYAVPLVYYFLRKVPGAKGMLPSSTSLVSGGCKLPDSVYNAYKQDLGLEIHEGYGLTEASPICTWHRPADKIKIDSVGRAFPRCQIKIVDDAFMELPVGQAGEICVKGPNIFKGYYNNTIASQKVLLDGWLLTGDIGKMDQDGYVYLIKQKKRMLNAGGNKVYPLELERFMRMNENVLTAEVTGEPDELLGAVINARVELKDKGVDAKNRFKKWCDEHITKYKVPRNLIFS